MTKTAQHRTDFKNRSCKACEGKLSALEKNDVSEYLKSFEGWSYENGAIVKDYKFENYDETTAFVNAVAWVARRENHHPDISFGYKTCRVAFMTHAVEGISENDFIAAAKVEALLET